MIFVAIVCVTSGVDELFYLYASSLFTLEDIATMSAAIAWRA